MKKIVIIFLIFSIAGIFAGLCFVHSSFLGICYSNAGTNIYDASCINELGEIGTQLLYGMSALAIVFLALSFVPRAFSWWWKFAIWYVPLAIVIFVNSTSTRAWLNPYPSPDTVYLWISGFYVLISFIIVTVFLILKRDNSKK